MTKHGALTDEDLLIMEHLGMAGPSTTKEIQEDLDPDILPRRVYARLARLHRLELLDRIQTGNSTPVMWWVP